MRTTDHACSPDASVHSSPGSRTGRRGPLVTPMTPNVEPLRPSQQDGSTRVFCATCGHSEFVHDGNRGCRYSVCDCNRFVVGAEARLDPSARSRPSP
jgi:hypothetical protein